MARTVFVNPSFMNPRRKRRKKSNPGQSLTVREAFALGKANRNPKRRKRGRKKRRNAGIAPFVRNPLIMSNPPRRRRRRRNPMDSLDIKTIVSKSLTFASGAGMAVAANAFILNRVDNFWARNVSRLGLGVVGAAFMPNRELGAASAGAMFYPLIQELLAKLLGQSTVTGTEADMDVLAADLEDIMDDLDESDLSDDDDYEVDLSDDEDMFS
jgi:hypothetical protein